MSQVLIGDCLQVLPTLEAGSVQTCVTSPPYWGLRDYGNSAQIGLEATHEEYVAQMVDVFREVRRVLRDDGTCWVNLGDSYSRAPEKGGSGPGNKGNRHIDEARKIMSETQDSSDGRVGRGDRAAVRNGVEGLPSKNLVGIPWRVAFALQADGWYLRQDIIWHKPNPMPESVRDRCTKSHEYIFLLSKNERYYFDADAIAEPGTGTEYDKTMRPQGRMAGARYITEGKGQTAAGANLGNGSETRNKRDVWTVTTKSFGGAHFATFPPDLIEPCILAGSRPGDVVLDPFGGSGTTGQVAESLGRQWVLIELNPEYAAMCDQRTAQRGLVLEP